MKTKPVVLAVSLAAVVIALLAPSTGGSSVRAALAPPGVHIGPGVSPAGYIPLDALGVAPTSIGDENLINLNVPSFLFNGSTHTQIGVDSNGYVVVDGGDPALDNNCCDPQFGPARPNGVLAPFWTDLDGSGAPGFFAADVTDGVNSWVVVEWRVNVFGTSSIRRFQVWIGLNGVQDISYTYDPATLQIPFGQPFLIGVENMDGTSSDSLPVGTLPTGDLVVTSDNNHPPTANAGLAQTVNGAVTVNLDGSGSSDPDGDPLTYAWTQTAGTTVTLTGADTATPHFTSPAGPATLTFNLHTCDTSNACDDDTVTITVSAINDQLNTLYNAVKNTPPGQALGNKLKQIQAYVAANNKAGACAGLNDFLNLVNAQKGKKLTNAQAADYTAQANAIKTSLGC